MRQYTSGSVWNSEFIINAVSIDLIYIPRSDPIPFSMALDSKIPLDPVQRSPTDSSIGNMSPILFHLDLPTLIWMPPLARRLLIRIPIRPSFLRSSPSIDLLIGPADIQSALLPLLLSFSLSSLELSLGPGIGGIKSRIMLGDLVVGTGLGCL